MTPNRKSNKRFEQLNRLVDTVCETLPTPSHVAVLLICYRHARAGGHFQVSAIRIGKAVGLKKRQTQTLMDDLERLGVIELLREHQGPIPRQYRITGRRANGAAHCTINKDHTPQINGAVQCA